MKLHTLLKVLPLIKQPNENPEVIEIVQDNRKVTKGSLFICIKGLTVDGHTFAKEAEEKGAVAIVAEHPVDVTIPVIIVKNTKRAMAILADAFYEQPTKKLHLIGITGTNGKTTTSHLIDQIFRDAGKVTGLIGTMYIKMAEQILDTKNTTPDSMTLQKTFKQMVDLNVDSAIMEVSSHALDQGRVMGCDYDIAVFTNLTQDHLDYHHTMEEYRRAKSLLFSQLGNTYDHNRPKFAVLNTDDPASEKIQKETAAHIISYGIDHEADFYAKNIEISAKGTTFTLKSPEGEHVLHIQLIGKFSIYNVLAAIAAAYVSNIPMEQIIHSIESIKGVAGRFELVHGGQDFPIIVDYSHTPDSLENVLKTIQHFAKKRVFVIVGCGGDRDKTKRPIMAQIACQYASDPIFTSDNPRSEDPVQILKDMEAGVTGKNYQTIVDRREAIFYGIKQAKSGDVVLIAGKGHETYQQIGDQILEFDDRVVALEAVKENG
ncbi:UDP-N-acetylmuramoyl-L-alanyl-D-glutamate--2,6-diaminopimelate ligase [Heyndrickxia sporothermodurans]|uniref:UDP-N-acetylmuramoyl-L-alanyl-D-glutamate--2,6-diaminopimelate ligase n=1 Tax=Heyndrickxia sporothermodurans TaxID=46224 RepID=A0A150L747_9BACI|nr:UDP-N-acetylmuramoyl-L-alanyl-D-glutamate--2,6-diaminopimelate ligase [Heyndrickxia sporothermodurans]KYD08147.1 UDP-N-acetylmuramoylalanyl-D-glutamate--2,6-diaminopimelate ligase [Heyndrickxia sporothermodurans]MBL5767860.1 UDP-N-acetylmuramoyl-L-alanyl-D-glutamate--2,6-diaminopimelate ligase [Heyndrickxia sporothermodurans]MBL5771443.1 UDP-N-acetylmuramoyl-L-alanyl-D-glutamate--2,6-diaminopimelate ligase [Heyndrickxia sporothermodurans]MBL5775119.1 UDP-N-acetylmuramoyl-L-alanyl-D-glutamate